MQSTATSVEEYFESLPEDRQGPMKELRKTIKNNLPKGFKEVMASGMVAYVVPLSIYPEGYHCNPKTPLPFMCLASQKNFISFYHMGVYADQKVLKWFTEEYAKRSKSKLDMGKSCIRFKKPEHIPFDLVGELVAKISVEEWINTYEAALKK